MAERHRLTRDRRTDDVVAITNDLIALHSSDPATVYLSALARMNSPAIGVLDRALYEDRSLVRHHAMRRTLWVMARDVARLAHGAATAKIARAERKRTVAALADSTDLVDPDNWLTDAYGEIVDVLNAEGPLSTRAIGERLPHLMLPVTFGVRTKHPAPIKAHTKVLQGAGFEATLIRARPTGNWNSAEYVWSPAEAWLGQAINGVDELPAAQELLARWLLRFGPATETDIKWWFGWTAGLTRKALEAAQAESVLLDDGSVGFVAPGDTQPPANPGPWVRLLPGLDPTPMGWKERDWYVDLDHVPRLFDRFGNVGPTVWVDGKVAGGWIQRPTGDIAVELVAELSQQHQRLLDEAIDELSIAVGNVVVRPRFPAPVQKDLFAT